MKNLFLCILSLVVLATMQGCGSSGHSSNTGQGLSTSSVTVTVTPSSASMDAGSSQVFKAVVTDDTTGGGVTWAVTGGGTLSAESSSSVTLTAPAAPGTVTLTATSKTDTTKSVKLTISVAAKPQIQVSKLATGIEGKPYSATMLVQGGVAPFTWSIVSGSLPPGLKLNANPPSIVGNPTTPGTYNFTLQIVDSSTPPQTVTPVHPRSRDRALRAAARSTRPCCCGRRNCDVNLNNLRWDRPDLDCEPQQARGIPRNLQLDETNS